MPFNFTKFTDDYATIEDLQCWAGEIMEQKPHFTIGEDYLDRWFVIPRNPFHNVYLHRLRRSDDDRAMHDHPWDNSSLLLLGSYREITPNGSFIRKPGDCVHRQASDRHRLELIGLSTVSLFITGPKVREWGFWCGPKADKFVHWRDFRAPNDKSMIGAGCGEYGEMEPVNG